MVQFGRWPLRAQVAVEVTGFARSSMGIVIGRFAVQAQAILSTASGLWKRGGTSKSKARARTSRTSPGKDGHQQLKHA